MVSAIPSEPPGPLRDVVDRAVRRRLAPAEETAKDEVRALLEAGLALIQAGDRGRSPRVADIVAAAGLSNDAFYRYFASKDDLVAAIVEDGARRLASYVRHSMEKGTDAESRLRLGIEAVMRQATDHKVAATTRAVFANATRPMSGDPHNVNRLVDWLTEMFAPAVAALGSVEPEADARVVAASALAVMQYCLWHDPLPMVNATEHLTRFAVRGIGSSPVTGA